jgi:hypothetical protein
MVKPDAVFYHDLRVVTRTARVFEEFSAIPVAHDIERGCHGWNATAEGGDGI